MAAPVSLYGQPATPPPPATSQPKYIRQDGRRILNPAYQGSQPTQPAVVCSMDDYARMETACGPIQFTPGTEKTIDVLQSEPFAEKIRVGLEDSVDTVTQVFEANQIPIGLASVVLQAPSHYEFILDNSGSMSNPGPTGRGTRWQELETDMLKSVEMLSIFSVQTVTFRCLHGRPVHLQREERENPEVFKQRMQKAVTQLFREQAPSGLNTPILEVLQQSCRETRGKDTFLIIACDGQPNPKPGIAGQEGVAAAQNDICEMLKARQNPEKNPICLWSLARGKDTEWMRELEEAVENCDEVSDFKQEFMEILGDQGDALPFNEGIHALCRIAGPLHPALDKRDEAIPFTKIMYDNYLGYRTTFEEYRNYFDQFVRAQKNNQGQSAMDLVKKTQNWEPIFGQLAERESADQIQEVRDFLQRLERAHEDDRRYAEGKPPAYAQKV